MLKFLKNKRNDLYIFANRDVRKLTCLTAKFQEEPIEPLREIAWRKYGIWRISQFWSGEEILVKKLGVNASVSLFNQIIMFTVT